jgi:hypothetical protein
MMVWLYFSFFFFFCTPCRIECQSGNITVSCSASITFPLQRKAILRTPLTHLTHHHTISRRISTRHIYATPNLPARTPVWRNPRKLVRTYPSSSHSVTFAHKAQWCVYAPPPPSLFHPSKHPLAAKHASVTLHSHYADHTSVCIHSIALPAWCCSWWFLVSVRAGHGTCLASSSRLSTLLLL